MPICHGMLHNTNHSPQWVIEQCMPNVPSVKTKQNFIHAIHVHYWIMLPTHVILVSDLCGWCRDWESSQCNQYYLTDGNDEGGQKEHSHSHPGDVGFQPPRLCKVTPALILSRSHFWAGEDEHLTDRTKGGRSAHPQTWHAKTSLS